MNEENYPTILERIEKLEAELNIDSVMFSTFKTKLVELIRKEIKDNTNSMNDFIGMSY